MLVVVTNLTDSSKSKHAPTQVDVYNRILGPGESIKLPSELITRRVRALEDGGLIAIGPVPSWYSSAKIRGRTLTEKEKKERIVQPVEKTQSTPKKDKESKKEGVDTDIRKP